MQVAHAVDVAGSESSSLSALTISELFACKRAIEKELAAATFKLTSAEVASAAAEHRADLRAVVAELKARSDGMTRFGRAVWNESFWYSSAWSSTPLSDDEFLLDDEPGLSLGQPPLLVPLHTMRLVDLLTRKRALDLRVAADSFVRAITHTSQVRRPLRKALVVGTSSVACAYRSCGVVRAAID